MVAVVSCPDVIYLWVGVEWMIRIMSVDCPQLLRELLDAVDRHFFCFFCLDIPI